MKNLNILLVLTAVLLFGFVGLPQKRSVEQLKKDILFLEGKKETKTKEFKQIQTKFKKLSENKSTKNYYIAQKFNQAELIEHLIKISQKSGIELSEGIQFSQTKEGNGLTRIDSQFTITGFRAQIRFFLKNVEANKLFMGVESFAVNQSEDTQTTFSVNLYSYYFDSTKQKND